MSQNKKIILFYKNLSNRGGAELLILKEYKHFKRLGCDVKLLPTSSMKDHFFAETMNFSDLIILESYNNFFKLVQTFIICVKYKKEIKIYCFIWENRNLFNILFVNLRYSIHIHNLYLCHQEIMISIVFLKGKFHLFGEKQSLKGKFINTK